MRVSTSGIDLSELELFDHHCHGVLLRDVDREGFESLISESSRPATPGTTRFDSQLGFQVLAHCAPVIDLEPFCDPNEYISRRKELGFQEVNRRFLQAAGITSYGLDTGHGAGEIYDPQQMATAANASAHEIVRLERLAETTAEQVRDNGGDGAALIAAITSELDHKLKTAIGVKSIAAYRGGLGFEPSRPSEYEVLRSAERMLETPGDLRLEDPVMMRHLIWLAIDRQTVIQFHIGYGDDDINLDQCNPLLLTDLLRASVQSGARFTLLHCYPFHREAGYLADVFPHVYFDVGLAINYTGSRSEEIIAESVELAPFGKILFSSDAWGAPELFFLGAKLFRRGLGVALSRFSQRDFWPASECLRIANMLGYDNAARVYRVDDRI
jgi:predicted TIM-barrel fold metal-dependent hydrolase